TGRLTPNEFVAVTSTNIARILNIYPQKGAILPGSDADLVIWDPEASKKVSAKTQHSSIDYNVFEGFELKGLPVCTLSRGRVAFDKGQVTAEPGDGRFIEREPHGAVNRALSQWKEIVAPRKEESRDEHMPIGVRDKTITQRQEPRTNTIQSMAPGRGGANAQTVIDIRNLSLVFETNDGPVHALSDIDLSIERGEFVSLIGPSGCGKTTLMRVIADLERPTAGSISVFGGDPERARLGRAYGYVFQAPTLQAWRTVERNVELPLEIMGMSAAERRRRSRDRLALVGLTGFERKYPWQLSGGMQQRVSIARALSFDPDLLLMDEPFGALDEITRDHLNEELLALWAKTGKTVIFVTHSIAEAVFL